MGEQKPCPWGPNPGLCALLTLADDFVRFPLRPRRLSGGTSTIIGQRKQQFRYDQPIMKTLLNRRVFISLSGYLTWLIWFRSELVSNHIKRTASMIILCRLQANKCLQCFVVIVARNYYSCNFLWGYIITLRMVSNYTNYEN